MENENTIKRSCSYSCSSEESDERPPFSQGLDYESSGADISGEGEGCSSSSSSSLTFSRGGTRRADVASSSDGWPESSSSAASATPFAFAGGRDTVIWEETKDRLNSQLSAMDMMKERFSKLLLGEDMSGCGKGVCSALAISNAITNLAASVFGEVWRLEPLSPARKSTWRREMEWMLSVTDSIVELIPTWQQDAEGSCLEVMISRPRSDLYINLPALKKLDAMLLEIFDSFTDTEFWYVDGGILLEDINNDASDPPRRLMQHQQDKWWLPVPRVPKTGLSECSRKQLQHHRECTGQILKAAVSINSTILSEMEVPSGYLDSLPKTGRDCLGDIIYRYITAEQFSPECLLDCLDLSSEHHILDIANRIEAAIHVWKQKAASTHINKGKPNRTRAKSSWRKVRILVGGFERRALLLERAESLLLTLKLRFPGLSQTVLDMNKIQDNKVTSVFTLKDIYTLLTCCSHKGQQAYKRPLFNKRLVRI